MAGSTRKRSAKKPGSPASTRSRAPARRARKPGPKRKPPQAPRDRRIKRWFLGAAARLLVLALLATAGLTAWLDLKVRAEFEGQRWALPATIYARPLKLETGRPLSIRRLEQELRASAFRRVRTPVRPGEFSMSAARAEIRTREFRYPDGATSAGVVHVRFENGRIATLRDAKGRPLREARMEPALIGKIYPAHKEDRSLHALGDYPPELVAGLVMVEDRDFFSHPGISWRGLARAMWQNMLAGEARQGGSTLTQQFAKNFFLSNERSLWRKFREALIALLLEFHYDKEVILEAYMNEIHLGQHGARAVHGFGSAAQFYFGRPVAELQLHESALLLALVRGGSYYNPRRHPERALERRNMILALMAERGVLGARRASAAMAHALDVTPNGGPASTRHPAFMELVRLQLREHFDADTLRSAGLRIFTTLEPLTQAAAERALAGLNRLEKTRRLSAGSLQGAIVVTGAHSGEVLAVVGDRHPRAFGFNRALHARRPIGSLIKPVVYLAAVAQLGYTAHTMVDDGPLSVALGGGKRWRPRNYDGKSHGAVTLHSALARSLNQASVRVGLDVGLSRVGAQLRELGVERVANPHPSLLLGAVELSPMEVAALYQPLAARGTQAPLRAISGVTDAQGRSLGRFLPRPHAVADPRAVAEVEAMMREVVLHGTARSASRRLPAGGLAGKTGTTDDLRDSWFAGFDAERLVVAWVGRDDNRPAGLSGASGALTLWTDVLEEVGVTPLPPSGILMAKSGSARPAAPTRTSQMRPGVAREDCEGDILGGLLNRIFGTSCNQQAAPQAQDDQALELN